MSEPYLEALQALYAAQDAVSRADPKNAALAKLDGAIGDLIEAYTERYLAERRKVRT